MAQCRTGKDKSAPRRREPRSGEDSQVGVISLTSGGPMRVLRLAQVMDMTGLRKTTIYEMQAQGTFPMRVKLTTHSVGWIEEDVIAWVVNRVAENRRDRRANDQKD